MDKSDAAGTSRFGFPIISPFTKYQLLEGVDADAERIRLSTLRLVWNIHIPPVQILGVDLVRMSASRCQEKSNIANRAIRRASSNSLDVVDSRSNTQVRVLLCRWRRSHLLFLALWRGRCCRV